jgi:hypothetical protein
MKPSFGTRPSSSTTLLRPIELTGAVATWIKTRLVLVVIGLTLVSLGKLVSEWRTTAALRRSARRPTKKCDVTRVTYENLDLAKSERPSSSDRR